MDKKGVNLFLSQGCWVGKSICFLFKLYKTSLSVQKNREWAICHWGACALCDDDFYLVFLLNRQTTQRERERARFTWEKKKVKMESDEKGCYAIESRQRRLIFLIKTLTIDAPTKHVCFMLRCTFSACFSGVALTDDPKK